MAIDLPHSTDRDSDEIWRELDQCLAEVAALAAQPLDELQFYAKALERAAWALAAPAAAAWARNGEGQWSILAQFGTPPPIAPAHGKIVTHAAQKREATVLPAGESLCLLAPVVVDGCALGLLEIFQRSDTPASALGGQERFLTAVADCAAEYHRNALLRQLRGRETWWRSFADFAARIAAAQDAARATSEIANGARTLLDVDRASIVAWSRGQAKMQALSGVDAFDDRAEAVLAAEALTAAVLQVNEALWFPAQQSLAPQVEQALARHLDASPAKALAVIPLEADENKPCGALLLERFSLKDGGHDWHDGWQHVVRQCAGGLDSVLAWQALPLGAWSRRVSAARRNRSGKPWSKAVIGGLTVVSLLAVLTLLQADFSVQAPGELQPVSLRHVFSGLEGEVVEVLAKSGETVRRDQVLARLRSPKLDLETSRVLGELQTAQARLATLESARLDGRFSTAEEAAKAQQLTAEEEELRESVKSLAAQQSVLNEERKSLEVKSPIAGQLLTPWDELDALPARPVRTGQQLFTVADVSGAWKLELQAPDRQIGHVLASRVGDLPQVVRFVVSTDPRTEYVGTVEDVALRAETNDDGEATVLVTASVDATNLAAPRPGATVQARIACGRRALGYVWFQELCDRAASWWTLHF